MLGGECKINLHLHMLNTMWLFKGLTLAGCCVNHCSIWYKEILCLDLLSWAYTLNPVGQEIQVIDCMLPPYILRKFVFTLLPWLHFDMRRHTSVEHVRVYYIMFVTKHVQHLLYYCVFIWGTINICVWGETAKGHKVIRPREGHAGEHTLLHKSRFKENYIPPKPCILSNRGGLT